MAEAIPLPSDDIADLVAQDIPEINVEIVVNSPVRAMVPRQILKAAAVAKPQSRKSSIHGVWRLGIFTTTFRAHQSIIILNFRRWRKPMSAPIGSVDPVTVPVNSPDTGRCSGTAQAATTAPGSPVDGYESITSD